MEPLHDKRRFTLLQASGFSSVNENKPVSPVHSTGAEGATPSLLEFRSPTPVGQSPGESAGFRQSGPKAELQKTTGAQKATRSRASTGTEQDDDDIYDDDSQQDLGSLVSESDEDTMDFISAHSGALDEDLLDDLSSDDDDEDEGTAGLDVAKTSKHFNSLRHRLWCVDLRSPWQAPHLLTVAREMMQLTGGGRSAYVLLGNEGGKYSWNRGECGTHTQNGKLCERAMERGRVNEGCQRAMRCDVPTSFLPECARTEFHSPDKTVPTGYT